MPPTSDSALRWLWGGGMNARPPDVNVDAPIGQPVRSVPSSIDSAWISCSLIEVVPIAPDR